MKTTVVRYQAKPDLLTLGYLPARQPDSRHFRLWEMAGAAHADAYTGQYGFNDTGDGRAELSLLDPTKTNGAPRSAPRLVAAADGRSCATAPATRSAACAHRRWTFRSRP